MEKMTVTPIIQISVNTDSKVFPDKTMSLSGKLFTRLNRIRLLLSKSTLVIRVRAVLSVDTLKRLTVTRRSICLPVRTVTISQTMTVLGL